MKRGVVDPYWTTSHRKTETERFKRLGSRARHLYLWLLKWENKAGRNSNGWFSRSLKDIAGDMGVSINTVRRAKDELIASGYIEEDNGKKERRKSWYRMV